jgi:hypothetical protein
MIAVGTIVGAGLFLSVGSWNQAAATGSLSCNNRTVQGSYGENTSGFISPDGGVTQIPFTGMGLFKLDGKGGLTGSDTVSIGGTVFPRQFTGTYAVAPDCTGTITFTDAYGNVGHNSATIVNGGDAAYLISTNPGDTISGTARRVGSFFFGN